MRPHAGEIGGWCKGCSEKSHHKCPQCQDAWCGDKECWAGEICVDCAEDNKADEPSVEPPAAAVVESAVAAEEEVIWLEEKADM